MKHLKVALVQYNTTQTDIESNTKTAVHFLTQAKEQDADIVLFPECFLTSYSCPDICERLGPMEEVRLDPDYQKWCRDALTEDGPAITQIRETAAKLNIGAVVTGFSAGAQSPRNTAWIIGREGEILLKYSKVHTCDFDWEQYLESGTTFPVCEFDGIKIGVMICYDREYPESARELMLQGAEIILHPNDCGSMAPRLRELSVRAMENMVGIAMANPPYKNGGCSCAYSPIVWNKEGTPVDNTILVADEHYEGLLYVVFDMDAIRTYREREDLGKYRKPGAYHFLKKG